MATVADVRELLLPTSLPATLVDELLAGVSPLWLMGESAEAVAGDLVLCHPALGPGEIRVTIRLATDPGLWHLTVVTRDRVGLLAATARTLSQHDLSIRAASATTWEPQALALQRLQVVRTAGPAPATTPAAAAQAGQTPASGEAASEGSVSQRWQRICADLQRSLGPNPPATPPPPFAARPPVKVSGTSQGGNRSLVRVRAPDGPGLAWAVTDWLAVNGCSIELARIDGRGGRADDTFVVIGTVDTAALAARLSGVSPVGGATFGGKDLANGMARLGGCLSAPWRFLSPRR